MQLRFYARSGHVVRPSGQRAAGQFVAAFGRSRRKSEAGIELPATQEPCRVDSESRDGKRILRLFSQTPGDQPLWPADTKTAAACGVPFVQVELGEDGEFHEAKSRSKSTAKPGGDAA